MKELIIRHILQWLVGLTAQQWTAAVNKVVTIAAMNLDDTSMKQAKFLMFWRDVAKNMPVWATNLVREMAVAYARRKGFIK